MTMPRARVRFRETMEGSWTPAGGGEPRPLSFTVTVRIDDLVAHLRDGEGALEGYLTAEGLATTQPVEGAITIRPVTGRFVRYAFSFEADDGRRLALDGRKNVRLLDLLRTMTELDARITAEDGSEVGSAHVRFDLKTELLPLLFSLRAGLDR